MRILFLSPYLPSRIRTRPFHWLRGLAGLGHRVHLLALHPPEDAGVATTQLEDLCASIDVIRLSRGRTLWNAGLALPTGRALQLAYSHHPGAERLAADLARRHRVDVVHVEHLRGAVLASRVSAWPRVFDAVDAIGPLFAAAAVSAPSRMQRWIARLDAGRSRRFERLAPSTFDRVLVTSPAEAEAFADHLAGGPADRVVALPNGVDLDYFDPRWQPASPPTVVFSGKLSYHANEAAARHLVCDIMPHVWRSRPDVRVLLAGKDPSPRLKRLAGPRVSLTGYVEDLRPYLASASVAVAPLVYGAGIQNKVLEAMALGVPVVASPAATRALQVRAGDDLIQADDEEHCARAIVQVIEDEALARRLSARGRRYIEDHHDWGRLTRRLAGTYEAAMAERRSAQPPP